MAQTYVMEEEAADPAECGTVDGGSGTPKERPFLLAIVRDGRVRMVKEGYHH